jgi:exonuclease VII small subunit
MSRPMFGTDYIFRATDQERLQQWIWKLERRLSRHKRGVPEYNKIQKRLAAARVRLMLLKLTEDL